MPFEKELITHNRLSHKTTIFLQKTHLSNAKNTPKNAQVFLGVFLI